ncbi:hypothetical protein N3Z17_02365 [Candidatus Bandiella numerosa]|uniref:hypothetical protein n=1 Tax=Candidatus Bandiella numerosa TaxID=2570586 RepID=UPI00249E3414|nr:hypothetical protein [Candidatus Bandiella numerosa]WHA05373.1 hypothetical protein N3Z17_02365 [Candidatus Bandiella numerosa]
MYKFVAIQDSDISDFSVEFLQGSLETIGENLAYGFFTINDFIKVFMARIEK